MEIVQSVSKVCIVNQVDDRDLLREHGLRVTAPRMATLSVIREHHHMSADDVASAVRERLGSISKQAIYDVLTALTDVRIIRRVVIEGRGSWYELDKGDNHHHITCTVCGKFTDVPCATGQAPCLDPSDDHGFHVHVAEVVYRGVCPECQQQQHQN